MKIKKGPGARSLGSGPKAVNLTDLIRSQERELANAQENSPHQRSSFFSLVLDVDREEDNEDVVNTFFAGMMVYAYEKSGSADKSGKIVDPLALCVKTNSGIILSCFHVPHRQCEIQVVQTRAQILANQLGLRLSRSEIIGPPARAIKGVFSFDGFIPSAMLEAARAQQAPIVAQTYLAEIVAANNVLPPEKITPKQLIAAFRYRFLMTSAMAMHQRLMRGEDPSGVMESVFNSIQLILQEEDFTPQNSNEVGVDLISCEDIQASNDYRYTYNIKPISDGTVSVEKKDVN